MSPELGATKALLHIYCGLSTFFSSIGGLEGHENTLLRDQATRKLHGTGVCKNVWAIAPNFTCSGQ